MSAIERVPLPEVRDLIVVGEPLPFRVLDEGERLLLSEGHVVGSERQFEALVDRGAWVERPKVEEVRRARAAAAGGGRPVVSVERQLTLFDLQERAIWDLDHQLRRLRRGQTSPAELEAYASSLQQLIDRDPEVALFFSLRQDDRRFALYAITHGLHCAVVGLLLARQLGMDTAAQATVVRAALTMNVGMLDLQTLMAEQGDPPTAKQMETIRAHPMLSVRLLQQAGVDDAAWLATVAEHHESDDGKGYPRGLSTVSETARVLRVADVYMAKLSPRARRPPMTPQNAARQLFQQAGGQPLATALVRAVGVHPPGTLVSLKSGEIGVVTRRPPGSASPMVATLTNTSGKPVTATQHRDTTQPDFTITAAQADAGELPKILPERVYGMLLA